MSLGKYEYKRLGLKGRKKPVLKPATPNSDEMRARYFNGDEWPITHEMLNEALKA